MDAVTNYDQPEPGGPDMPVDLSSIARLKMWGQFLPRSNPRITVARSPGSNNHEHQEEVRETRHSGLVGEAKNDLHEVAPTHTSYGVGDTASHAYRISSTLLR